MGFGGILIQVLILNPVKSINNIKISIYDKYWLVPIKSININSNTYQMLFATTINDVATYTFNVVLNNQISVNETIITPPS